MPALCRTLADTMLEQRDDDGQAGLPDRRHARAGLSRPRTTRWPTAAATTRFVYLNVRMAAGRSEAVKKRTGDALLGAVRSALRAAASRSGTSASRCRSTKPRPGVRRQAQQPASALQQVSATHARQERSSSSSPPSCTKARSRACRCEHFSKRYPEMTIEDGYAISREWVKTQDRRRPRGQGPQDRPHLARDAAVQPDHEPDYGTLLDDMFFEQGGDIPFDALHRAARRGRAGLRARQARCRGRT